MTTKKQESEENKKTQKEKRKSEYKSQTAQIPVPLQNVKPQNSSDQPTTPKSEDLEKEKEKMEDMVQGFMGSQSGLFSSVSRTLIFGIIGTIWVITYSEHKLTVPNNWLLVSLVMSLLYLLADVGHYFLDAMSYQEETKRISGYKSSEELKANLKDGLAKINGRSVNFIKIKMVLLISTAIIFVIGLFLQLTAQI